MKTKNVIKPLFLGVMALVAVSFSSCSSNGTKTDDHAGQDHGAAADSAATTASVTPEFEDEKLANVYQQYIAVKTAMVKTDAGQSQTAAAELQTALIEAGSTSGADLAGKIASNSDIYKQRAEFDALTSEVEKLIKASKIKSGTVYKQYCPMAYDGNGAYWLANESDIRNPYYGDEMLECGEVKEEIK